MALLFLLLGWHTKFDDFESIDFFDICLETGIVSSSSMGSNNHSILQIPLGGPPCFGYPILGIFTIGLQDRFTFGWYGLVFPFQPRIMETFVNTTGSHNQLLLTESTLATINPGTTFCTAFYMQAYNFYQGLIGTVAYSYTCGLHTDISPIYQIKIVELPTSDSWNLGALIFELDYNFATELKPRAPVVSGFFSMPVSGKLYQKSYLFGGSCTLQINYDF